MTAIAYPDTSFLASLYGEDSNSTAAVEEYQRSNLRLVLTPLAEFELMNAFRARVFRKESNASQTEACLRNFEADVSDGLFLRRTVPAGAYERAMALSQRHTPRLGSRAMDILHVAIALDLGAGLFLTFDHAQKRLALAAGIKVRPT